MIQDYLRLGMALVAIPRDEKGPREAGWGAKRCEDVARLERGNVGINHALSGTCCLDVDDAALFKAWWVAQGFPAPALKQIIAACPVWTSGKPNRWKALFRAPEGMRTVALHQHGFELRAAGGQDVLPPSVVTDDAGTPWAYYWLNALPPSLDDVPMLPAKLLAKAQGTPRQATGLDAPTGLLAAVLDVVPSGGRNDYLSRACYAKIKAGVEGDDLVTEMLELNATKCVPPLDEDEVMAIVRGKVRARIGPAPEVELWKALIPWIPDGYRLHAGALQWKAKNEDTGETAWDVLLHYPVAVTNVIRVPGAQEQRYIEVTILNPHEVKHHVTMAQLSRECEQTFNNIGISVYGKKANGVKAFLIASKDKLEREQKVTDSFKQFGWQSDDRFLVGNRLYRAGQVPVYVHLEPHAAQLARFMPLVGDVNAWRQAALPMLCGNNIKQLFAFMCSLAAPLMKLSGERGGILSLTGPSGQGKSTVQSAITSVFGTQESAFSKAQDTENARVAFLSIMHNLPVQAEELTKLDGAKLAVLAYDVSEGRDKRRLDRSGQMREMAPEWHTILTSSSNTSIIEKLMDLGAVPEAYRVLEMRVTLPPNARLQDGDMMKRVMLANAGSAGHVLAQYLVDHKGLIAQGLEKVKGALQAAIQAPTEERIRVNMVAGAAMMARIVKAALDMPVDANAVLEFGRELILAERENRSVYDSDATQAVTDFVNENIAHCVQTNMQNVVFDMIRTTPPYTMRYEARARTLYISFPLLRRYALERRLDWADMQKELRVAGIMRGLRKVTLTKGVSGVPPQGQTQCLEIDTDKLGFDFKQDEAQAA